MSEQIDNQHAIGLIEDYLNDPAYQGYPWSGKPITMVYHLYDANLYEVYVRGEAAALIFEIDLDEDKAQFAVGDLIYRADEPVTISTATIVCEDAPVHTDEHPFCSDQTCPCHEEIDLVQEHILTPWLDGLLTNEEGERLMTGRQL